MYMAAYNDYFNLDKNVKDTIKKKDNKVLKNSILKSVKVIIDQDKNKMDNK